MQLSDIPTQNRHFVCEPYHSGVGTIVSVEPSHSYGYSITIEAEESTTTSRLMGVSATRPNRTGERYMLHRIPEADLYDPKALLRYVYPV